MAQLTLLLDFDGTLVDQDRLEAYRLLTKRLAVSPPKGLPRMLYERDVLLCAREMYDRKCVLCEFRRFFPGITDEAFRNAFWSEVHRTQRPREGCVNVLGRLKDAGHRLICATDTDGPGTDKFARVQASGLARFFDDIIVGSERDAPRKGELAYIKYILRRSKASKSRCVMVGDKPKSDLLPARSAGISTVLVRNPEYPATWPVEVGKLSGLYRTIQRMIGCVFISYSHVDSKFVDQLDKGLRQKGINVWRDILEPLAGKPLADAVSRAIRTSTHFVVVMSRASLKSEWVHYEVNQAVSAALADRRHTRTILPVLAEDICITRAFPQIGHIGYVDFHGRFKAGLHELADRIRPPENAS